MQKIWICGAKGQIGQAINEIIDKLEFKVLDTDIDDLVLQTQMRSYVLGKELDQILLLTVQDSQI